MKAFSIVFTIFLLNFINLTDNVILRFVPTIAMGILFLYNLLLHKKDKIGKHLAWVYILILLFIIGILRNNNPLLPTSVNLYKLTNFLLFFVVLRQTVNVNIGKFSLNQMIVAMLYKPIVSLIIINFLLYSSGLGLNASKELDQGGEDSLILSALGYSFQSKSLPFVIGFAEHRAMIGLFLTLFLLGYSLFPKNRVTMLFGAITTTIILLFIDTRAALVYPFLIFLLFYIVLKKMSKPRFLWLLPLLTIFGSSMLLIFLSYVSQASGLSDFSRSSEDLATANSRSIIWFLSSLEFLQFKAIHLIGYGEYGHYESGASQSWADIFVQWQNGFLISPHSSFYTILFDYGYIGLTFIVLLQYKIISLINKYWNEYSEVCILVLGFLLYWNLIGITESFFGFYAQNLIYFFVFFTLLISILDYKKKSNNLKFTNENKTE